MTVHRGCHLCTQRSIEVLDRVQPVLMLAILPVALHTSPDEHQTRSTLQHSGYTCAALVSSHSIPLRSNLFPFQRRQRHPAHTPVHARPGAPSAPALLSTQNPRSGVLSARSSAALSRRPTSSTRTSSFTFMIMPANCGSVGWKTVWQRRWRPRAARTPRVRSGRPIAERWRVMRK